MIQLKCILSLTMLISAASMIATDFTMLRLPPMEQPGDIDQLLPSVGRNKDYFDVIYGSSSSYSYGTERMTISERLRLWGPPRWRESNGQYVPLQLPAHVWQQPFQAASPVIRAAAPTENNQPTLVNTQSQHNGVNYVVLATALAALHAQLIAGNESSK